jgi:hypothetical protein
VFQTLAADTPLMVMPVSGSVVGAISASFCVIRAAATDAVRRPFQRSGSARAYSAFTR